MLWIPPGLGWGSETGASTHEVAERGILADRHLLGERLGHDLGLQLLQLKGRP